MNDPDRRDFLKQSAALIAWGGTEPLPSKPLADQSPAEFADFQSGRRKELWGLLGDLPSAHKPASPVVTATEKYDRYTLQKLVLDLNGIEPVPALLLIPDKRDECAPGMLYIHWHGGMYDLGKKQLLVGVDAQPAYAPVCAEKGAFYYPQVSWVSRQVPAFR